MRVRWGGAAAAAADGAGRWHGAQVLRGRDALCFVTVYGPVTKLDSRTGLRLRYRRYSLTQQCGQSETLLEFDARQSDYKI
jgi:hypothetical protein